MTESFGLAIPEQTGLGDKVVIHVYSDPRHESINLVRATFDAEKYGATKSDTIGDLPRPFPMMLHVKGSEDPGSSR